MTPGRTSAAPLAVPPTDDASEGLAVPAAAPAPVPAPNATRADSAPRTGTFAALVVPNFRRFVSGQAVSLVGTWMQSVAQAWLVLTLTHSGSWLGLVIAAQTLPVLLGGPYGGVIVDRVDKRKLLLVTQASKGLNSLLLGILVITGEARLWEVFALAIAFGVATVFDNTARQSFVSEMVGPEYLRNAVTLNSVMVNAARAIGPAIAGVLIATVGVGVCFLVDAGSYVVVIAALATLNVSALYRGKPQARAKGQLREGLQYVRRTPILIVPLLMMAVIGTLAYEFTVVLPVFAKETFHGGANSYGFMTAAMGVGAVIGGLQVARRGRSGIRPVVIAAAAFGLAICLTALAPSLPWALVGLLFVGAGSVSFLSVANTTIQLASDPAMRGRVMSLWFVAFLGSTPIGGPIIGVISQHAGARYGLLVGGVAALVAAALGALTLRGKNVPGPADPAGLAPETRGSSRASSSAPALG